MNDRYKQFAKQATTEIMGIPVLDQELFAELIARDCANICTDLSFTPEGPSHEAKYQRNLCALEIQKQYNFSGISRKVA